MVGTTKEAPLVYRLSTPLEQRGEKSDLLGEA